jgi:type II secretory pathway pseudopilin PulG
MNIWNMVMLVLAILLAIVAIPFASRVYKTRNAWDQSIVNHDKAIAQAKADTEKAIEGTSTEPGSRDVNARLANLHLIRGTVWEGCTPTQFSKTSPELASIQLKLDPESAASTPMEMATIVYIFEAPRPSEDGGASGNASSDDGSYLGSFRVTKTVHVLIGGKTMDQNDWVTLAFIEVDNFNRAVTKTRHCLFPGILRMG